MEKITYTFDQLPEAVYKLCLDVKEIKRLLIQQVNTIPFEEDLPLKIQQAADFLNVSRQTVYQNIDKIPHRKRHGRLYFYKAELAAYLNGKS